MDGLVDLCTDGWTDKRMHVWMEKKADGDMVDGWRRLIHQEGSCKITPESRAATLWTLEEDTFVEQVSIKLASLNESCDVI